MTADILLKLFCQTFHSRPESSESTQKVQKLFCQTFHSRPESSEYTFYSSLIVGDQHVQKKLHFSHAICVRLLIVTKMKHAH